MQNSFLLYADYEKKFELLNEVEQGKLIMAIFAFNRGEDLTDTLDSAGKMALSFITDQMKRDGDTYEKTKIARSEAGKRGMATRWGNKNNNVITNDNKDNNVINVINDDNNDITSDNQNNYNVNDNDNVNGNDNVDVNVSKNKKQETAVLNDDEINSLIKEKIKQPSIQARFIDYVNNRKAMGRKYAIKTETALNLNISKLKKYSKNTVENALAVLDYSISNNYQGLFDIFEKQEKTASKPQTTNNANNKVSNEEVEAWSES